MQSSPEDLRRLVASAMDGCFSLARQPGCSNAEANYWFHAGCFLEEALGQMDQAMEEANACEQAPPED